MSKKYTRQVNAKAGIAKRATLSKTVYASLLKYGNAKEKAKDKPISKLKMEFNIVEENFMELIP
jgi:hypothetical protein